MRIVWRICTVIAVGYCVLLGLAFVRGMLQPLLEEQERAELEAGAMEAIDRFSDALDEGWTESGRGTSRVVSMVYASEEGEELICYICQTNVLSGELPRNEDGLAIVLNEVIDPDTAETSRACEVNGQDAMLYEKDGRAYLCWTVSQEYSLALEYDPDAVPEADIFRMAESAVLD